MFTEVQNCGSRLDGSTEEAAILRRWAKLKSKLKRLFEIALQTRHRRVDACFHLHFQSLAHNQEIDTPQRPHLKVHKVQTDPKNRYCRLPLPPDKRECHARPLKKNLPENLNFGDLRLEKPACFSKRMNARSFDAVQYFQIKLEPDLAQHQIYRNSHL